MKKKNQKKSSKDNTVEEAKDKTAETKATQNAEESTNGQTGEETTEKAGGVEEEVIQLEKQNAELKDKYLRLYAEFDNFKRRTVKEKLELMRTAAQDTMTALLPVLDDFDRAKKNAEDDKTTEVFTEGIQLVYQKLYSVLTQKGLEPMESTGEVFDPELHEALTEIPAPSEDMKGKIIDTIEKGYKLGDKIIRHAKVVTGK
ncbi:MAG: nucleotide exchange factor GrpE [Saprospiraceae bacterium]|nr:nucleotide exchange factor GrpE [Saprospiraceae bacterium]